LVKDSNLILFNYTNNYILATIPNPTGLNLVRIMPLNNGNSNEIFIVSDDVGISVVNLNQKKGSLILVEKSKGKAIFVQNLNA